MLYCTHVQKHTFWFPYCDVHCQPFSASFNYFPVRRHWGDLVTGRSRWVTLIWRRRILHGKLSSREVNWDSLLLAVWYEQYTASVIILCRTIKLKTTNRSQVWCDDHQNHTGGIYFCVYHLHNTRKAFRKVIGTQAGAFVFYLLETVDSKVSHGLSTIL